MYSSRRLWWWSRGASNTFAGVQYRAYWVVWLGAILLALLGADLLALRLHRSGSYRLDLGFWGDQEVLTGFWEQEWDGTGASYRWTQASSALVVRGFAAVSRASLTLDIGGLPPTAPGSHVVSTEVDGVGWTTLRVMAAPRRYHLLLPPHALLDGNLDIQFRSDTSRVPPDPRAVGFRLDDLTLAWLPGSSVSPAWQTLLIQWAVVLVGMAVAWRLEAPRPVIAGLAAGLVILLSSMTAYSLFMATTWEKRLLVAGLLLMMLAWNAVPLLGRLLPGLARNELRWLAVIVVAALAVRFLGVCYPPFGSHDIHIHRGRLHHIRFGSLYLFDTPTEFGNGLTLVPPAFYLLALPFTVGSADPKGILEGLYALFDGSSPLLIALFVRQFGGSPRAVLLAAIALAGLPIQFTAVWWGFGPQIAGQWLLLLLALLVGQESVRARAGLVAAGMLFCLALLTHPGVALLGGFWLAGYVVLTW
ncbi:MAG: hypothetical protein M3380_12965, partial [Chloroflexota bacterium]|nr:hypothetical protein [Chloroflexota bacterium]